MDIKQAIKKTGKTQGQIAEEAGVSQTHVSLIASGQRRVGYRSVVAVARVLNVTPAELRPDLASMFEQDGDAA